MIRFLDSKLGDRTFGIVGSAVLFLPALITILVVLVLNGKRTGQGKAPLGQEGMMIPLITWVSLSSAALLFYSVFYANTPNQPSYESISKKD